MNNWQFDTQYLYTKSKKNIYIYIHRISVEIHRNLFTHTHNVLHPSELTPLASAPLPPG